MTMRRWRRKPSGLSSQQGQALTEFLVASLVVVPLFLLIPMIGKYQDMAHNTLMASRYVAFDAITRNDRVNSWKPEAQLAQEVQRRFFSNSRAPIKTGDAAGNFRSHRNGMWTDPFGNPLLRDFDQDVRVSYGFSGGATHNAGFSGSRDGAPFPLMGRFDLSRRGIYTANVAVTVANLPAGLRLITPFDDINLVINRSTTVLLDPWTGRNPQDVQTRLRDSVVNPGSLLANIRPMTDLVVDGLDGRILGLGDIRGPRLGDVQFWRDVVPSDRLR
jgi:hypothetical protein